MEHADEPWRGILIEASIGSTDVLDHLRVLGTKQSVLEGEPDRGRMQSWRVEVSPEKLPTVIALGEATLESPGWYFHLTRRDEMVVIFPGHTEQFRQHDEEARERAIAYGVERAGVPLEQIQVQRFFGNPFDE
jgi:hypothetical protein